ncbi:MAG: 6-pyruvoyl trahydropterin synthase family protein [Bryobacteraceae bacterium]
MESVITAERYHDISCGHRVVGHESKCAFLHGHNYRITFSLQTVSGLDQVGRVLDFSVIKDLFCQWLEAEWDHKMLLWSRDPLVSLFCSLKDEHTDILAQSVVIVSFNPTAENMAEHLLTEVCPALLFGCPGVLVTQVRVEETRKCSVVARFR